MSWFGLGAESGTENDPIEAEVAATAASPPPSSLSRSSRLEGRTSNRRSSADPPTGSSSSSAANNYHSMMQDHQDALSRPSPSSSTAAEVSRTKTINKTRQPSSPKRRNSASSPTHTNPKSHSAYRGFSTSIGDMFVHPSHERVDCCAMVCCGIFQSDRDRYLLQGVTPPSPWKRVWVHAIVPILLFCMAGYVALNIPDKTMNQMLVLCFLLGLVASIVGQCQKGRHKRMDIRKDVLWYKHQLHQHRINDTNDSHGDGGFSSLDQILDQPRPHDNNMDDDDVDHHYYRGQSARDIGCAHPYCFLLGCYPTDRRPRGGGQLLMAASDDHPVEESLCHCLFHNLCGRDICGMVLCQLGGVCGMAQESREIELALLPPAYRRLDYVSMQPMLGYFEKIYNQRWRQFHTLNTSGMDGPRAVGPFDVPQQPEGWLPYIPLSGLSITILQGWVALTVWLGIWSVLGPLFWTQMVKGAGRRHYFSVPDYIVYLASWLVCLGTFAVVVYFFQRRKPLELSVDSMIKYFASGFVLSTTLAIFYELVVGLTLRLMILVYMAFSGINVVEDREYNMEWIRQPLSRGFAGGPSRIYTEAAAADGEDYLPVFGRDHPFVYSIYLFFTAFFLAALVEEVRFGCVGRRIFIVLSETTTTVFELPLHF